MSASCKLGQQLDAAQRQPGIAQATTVQQAAARSSSGGSLCQGSSEHSGRRATKCGQSLQERSSVVPLTCPPKPAQRAQAARLAGWWQPAVACASPHTAGQHGGQCSRPAQPADAEPCACPAGAEAATGPCVEQQVPCPCCSYTCARLPARRPCRDVPLTAAALTPACSACLACLQGDATYLIVTSEGNIESYGLNAVCTHLGCVVPWNKAENKVGGAVCTQGRAGAPAVEGWQGRQPVEQGGEQGGAVCTQGRGPRGGGGEHTQRKKGGRAGQPALWLACMGRAGGLCCAHSLPCLLCHRPHWQLSAASPRPSRPHPSCLPPNLSLLPAPAPPSLIPFSSTYCSSCAPATAASTTLRARRSAALLPCPWPWPTATWWTMWSPSPPGPRLTSAPARPPGGPELAAAELAGRWLSWQASSADARACAPTALRLAAVLASCLAWVVPGRAPQPASSAPPALLPAPL